jgi:hypothetical protein
VLPCRVMKKVPMVWEWGDPGAGKSVSEHRHVISVCFMRSTPPVGPCEELYEG